MTFEDHVRAALDELPPHLAAALENVVVVIDDENPEDPDLLGLYHGVPLTERGDVAGMPPDTISIYEAARGVVSRSAAAGGVRITVLHDSPTTSGSTNRLADLDTTGGNGLACETFQPRDTRSNPYRDRAHLGGPGVWRVSRGGARHRRADPAQGSRRLTGSGSRFASKALRFGEREEIVVAPAEERLERAA